MAMTAEEKMSAQLELIVSADSFEEAVTAGLQQLKLPRSLVRVEVLESPDETSLFRWKKATVVRLVPDPQIHGSIAIQNGQLAVRGPVGPGIPATVEPAPGVAVRVKGVQVEAPVPVTMAEDLSLEITARLPDEQRFTLEVAPDRMSVLLRVNPRGRYVLGDQQSTRHLIPRLVLTSGTTVKRDEVEEALAKLGVCFGIDQKAIDRAIREASGEPRLIARGNPGIPGKDGGIRWSFPTGGEPGSTIKVEPGTTLGFLEPPVAPHSGWDVFGAVFNPPPGRDYQIRAGSGVAVTAEGRVVALEAGRPSAVRYRSHLVVRIARVHHRKDHIDELSGDLTWHGDLVISGSVTRGHKVTCQGNVVILGNVTRGSVHAGGTVYVQGSCTAAEIRGGGWESLLQVLVPKLAQLSATLGELQDVIDQLRRSAAFKQTDLEQQEGLGPLLRMLLERKFPQLQGAGAELTRLLNRHRWLEEGQIRQLQQILTAYWTQNRLYNVRTATDLQVLRQSISAIHKRLEAEMGALPELVVGSCDQESTLECSGSILVLQGATASHLVAGSDVTVKGPVRGGRVQARGDITLSEAGSEAAIPTRVETPPDRTIQIAHAHPMVEVQVGALQHMVTEPGRLVAYLNPEGELCITAPVEVQEESVEQ